MSTELSPTNQKRIIEICTFLRELRINYAYTQAEVAEEIHLSRNSISKIERIGMCRLQHLLLLLDFYEINLNEFFMDIK